MATIRPRNISKIPFDIHHDYVKMDDSDVIEEDLHMMDESKATIDDENPQGLEYYDSDDSDGVVDPSVLEDMAKFEQTFIGIKDRFRLINRIGEGKSIALAFWHFLTLYRHFFYCI
jgi:cell division control protein 7